MDLEVVAAKANFKHRSLNALCATLLGCHMQKQDRSRLPWGSPKWSKDRESVAYAADDIWATHGVTMRLMPAILQAGEYTDPIKVRQPKKKRARRARDTRDARPQKRRRA